MHGTTVKKSDSSIFENNQVRCGYPLSQSNCLM